MPCSTRRDPEVVWRLQVIVEADPPRCVIDAYVCVQADLSGVNMGSL